jgi:hypothetical protein
MLLIGAALAMSQSAILEGVALIGRTSMIVAWIVFMGWIQEGDPDCVYSTEVFLQLRMCAPEIVGTPRSAPLAHLAVAFGIFLFGALCVWHGASKKLAIRRRSR